MPGFRYLLHLHGACGISYSGMSEEKVIEAAIQLANGVVLYLSPPARHPSVLLKAERNGHSLIGHLQGFMTDRWRFVDRNEAYRLAEASGQFQTKPSVPGTLYTEDLW